MANNREISPVQVYLGENRFHENWSHFLILGISLLILGILAIIGANYATLTSIVYFGILLLIGWFWIMLSLMARKLPAKQ